MFSFAREGCMCRGVGLLLAVVMGGVLGIARASGEDAADPQIEAARERGLAYLRRDLGGTAGVKALVATVLLKSGEAPDSPHVSPTLDAIARRVNSDGVYTPESEKQHTEIYEAAVSLMALANADPDRYGKQIDAIAKFIMVRQKPEGGFDYPSYPGGDTSVTQYAALGLWDAVRSGTRVPLRVWDRIATWHLRTQAGDGGFGYKPGNAMHPSPVNHSMTTAGVSTLYITRLHLYPRAAGLEPEAVTPAERDARKRRKYGFLHPVDADDELSSSNPSRRTREAAKPGDNTVTVAQGAIDRAIQRGTEWITTNYSIKANNGWDLYYLYTMERFGALAGTDFIGDHPWYDEGAAELLRTQTREGSWTDGSGSQAATGFGVLFLARATRKLLNRQVRTRQPKLGTGLLMGGRGLPKHLEQLQVDEGSLTVKKLKGPVADLLAELEKGESQQVESAQAALVDLVLLDKPEELVGRLNQLKRMISDPRPEVRRTAYWALGRTDDQRLAPILIEALNDPDPDCLVEAQQALVFLSRKPAEPDLPEEITEADRQALVTRWKTWYFFARPYDERDDLTPDPISTRGKRP